MASRSDVTEAMFLCTEDHYTNNCFRARHNKTSKNRKLSYSEDKKECIGEENTSRRRVAVSRRSLSCLRTAQRRGPLHHSLLQHKHLSCSLYCNNPGSTQHDDTNHVTLNHNNPDYERKHFKPLHNHKAPPQRRPQSHSNEARTPKTPIRDSSRGRDRTKKQQIVDKEDIYDSLGCIINDCSNKIITFIHSIFLLLLIANNDYFISQKITDLTKYLNREFPYSIKCYNIYNFRKEKTFSKRKTYSCKAYGRKMMLASVLFLVLATMSASETVAATPAPSAASATFAAHKKLNFFENIRGNTSSYPSNIKMKNNLIKSHSISKRMLGESEDAVPGGVLWRGVAAKPRHQQFFSPHPNNLHKQRIIKIKPHNQELGSVAGRHADRRIRGHHTERSEYFSKKKMYNNGIFNIKKYNQSLNKKENKKRINENKNGRYIMKKKKQKDFKKVFKILRKNKQTKDEEIKFENYSKTNMNLNKMNEGGINGRTEATRLRSETGNSEERFRRRRVRQNTLAGNTSLVSSAASYEGNPLYGEKTWRTIRDKKTNKEKVKSEIGRTLRRGDGKRTGKEGRKSGKKKKVPTATLR